MIGDTNTKLLRLESLTDHVLATLIELPPPLTFACTFGALAGCVLLGWWMGG